MTSTSSKTQEILVLEEKASDLERQIAWASGAREFRLREELAGVKAHIRFLEREDDSDPAQIKLF